MNKFLKLGLMFFSVTAILASSNTSHAVEGVLEQVKADVNIEGLMQLQYGHSTELDDTFDIRRSEILFSGKLSDNLSWKIKLDPAKDAKLSTTSGITQDSRMLQDFIISVRLYPNTFLDLGQYKIPLMEEGIRSSSMLNTIERSFVVRLFADKRDQGVQLRGGYENVFNSGVALNYRIALMNGEAQNTPDSNDQKDLITMIMLKPNTDLQAYVSTLQGRQTDAAVDKNRTAFGLKYNFKPANLGLATEYITAEDDTIESAGWYGEVVWAFMKQCEAVLKYDNWEMDDESEKINIFVAGLNHYPSNLPNTKLQLNYVGIEEEDTVSGIDKTSQIVGQFQLTF